MCEVQGYLEMQSSIHNYVLPHTKTSDPDRFSKCEILHMKTNEYIKIKLIYLSNMLKAWIDKKSESWMSLALKHDFSVNEYGG